MGRLPMESHSQVSYPPQPQPQVPMESHSQVPYPPQPQPQSQPQAGYYPYSSPPPSQPQPQPQPQQGAVVYPPSQNNAILLQVPPYQPIEPNKEPNGKPVQYYMPMPSPQVKVVNNGSWTTGLFDCMDDPTNALITALFPCVTFGQIADVLDNGHTNCATSGIIYAFAPCFVSAPYRRKLRQRFGLVEAPASDRIIHLMFEPCGLCQEYRELNNRGINPALGHHGNLSNQQNSAATMVPPSYQMMN